MLPRPCSLPHEFGDLMSTDVDTAMLGQGLREVPVEGGHQRGVSWRGLPDVLKPSQVMFMQVFLGNPWPAIGYREYT